MQKYYITTDTDIFSNLTYIDSENIKDKNIDINIEVIIAFGIFFAIIMAFLIDIQKNMKLKQKLKQNPNYINNIIYELENYHIHPLQIRKNNSLSINRFLLIVIFDLCRRNEVYITNEEIIISKNN